MGFFSGLFKDKKKDRSRNPSVHEQHHHHHDAAASDDKLQQPVSPSHEVTPLPRHTTPQAEHSKEIPRDLNEQLPPAQSNSAPQAAEPPKAPQQSQPPQQPVQNDAGRQQQRPTQRPQTQQRTRGGLQPAYRYTGGEFSETISREEAMLAKQYNFASPEDRARAELTPSATRRAPTQQAPGQPNSTANRNSNAPNGNEFDALFTQFMHETGKP